MKFIRTLPLALLVKKMLIAFVLPAEAAAQNTGSVFSPDVVKGQHAAEYRASYDLDEDFFAHRIHYQYGFTESLRGRAILAQRREDSDDFDFRYLRLEALWQFLEDEQAGWDSGLRFELQIADGDDAPHRARIGWGSKVDIDERWQARVNLISGREFGDDASDGFLLETRAEISCEIADPVRLGVDYYGDLNHTGDVGGFDEQGHQVGPLVKFDLGGGWKGQAGPLFGLSDAAPDTELRLFIMKEF